MRLLICETVIMNIQFYIIYMFILVTHTYRYTEGARYRTFGRYNKCSSEKNEFCVKIRECPFFEQLLKLAPIPRPRSIIKIIRNRECGMEKNEPKVCCTVARNNDDIKNVKQSQHITKHFNLRLLPRNDCGKISINFLITNGQKTTPLEFPWMALLAYHMENGITFKCGGTVINNRYVLTAAHCITSTLAGVRLGEHNVNTEIDCDSLTGICSTSQVQDYYVEQVIIHQNYKPDKSPENDVALIRLATPAHFSQENIQPICLPIGEAAAINLETKILVVAGWGRTETGYRSAELLKNSVPIVQLEECKNINNNYASLTHKQICAGGLLGQDACSGDSGGPLQYVYYQNGKPQYVQYGIVSYGPTNCGTPGLPGVYTNVVYYITWILNNIMP